MRRPLAIVLAAGSLAAGVPAVALAAGGDSDPSAPAAAQPVQQQPDQPRDGNDCPKHDGGGSGGDAAVEL